MNVIKLSDVVTKKKSALFIVIVILSLVVLLMQSSIENNLLNLLKESMTKISQFMIYIGLISVLTSSVTWKWERKKNEKTEQFEFIEREVESPQTEFNRRRLFALGVFTSIYGTAMQVALVFIQ